jgi:HEAT repeat protein
MTFSKNVNARTRAARLLGSEFSHLEDKDQAWQDLHRLTQDDYRNVLVQITDTLGLIFAYVPNRDLAWQDLHMLTHNDDNYVKLYAAEVVHSVLPHIPDKNQAWQDLNRLIQVEHNYLHLRLEILASAFPYALDKERAWRDLIRLTQNQHIYVRRITAYALGSAYPLVPNKLQAWQDLIRLTQGRDREVKCFAYHALGRASILKATEAENNEEFKAQMEEAIGFFNFSSQEASFENPSAFCLPFYRSLHGLLFTAASKDAEIKKFLAEARVAVEESESRYALLDIVENLSNALQEVESYTVEDIVLKKRDLKTYTRYCFQVIKCMKTVQEKAPFAIRIIDTIAVEKSLFILSAKIKNLLIEVEETARKLCQGSKGTELEALGKSTYEGTKGLGRIESLMDAERYFEDIIPILQAHCGLLPEASRAYFGNLINLLETASLEQRFQTLKAVLLAALVNGEQKPIIIQTETNIKKVSGPILSGSFREQVNFSKNEGNHKP